MVPGDQKQTKASQSVRHGIADSEKEAGSPHGEERADEAGREEGEDVADSNGQECEGDGEEHRSLCPHSAKVWEDGKLPRREAGYLNMPWNNSPSNVYMHLSIFCRIRLRYICLRPTIAPTSPRREVNARCTHHQTCRKRIILSWRSQVPLSEYRSKSSKPDDKPSLECCIQFVRIKKYDWTKGAQLAMVQAAAPIAVT